MFKTVKAERGWPELYGMSEKEKARRRSKYKIRTNHEYAAKTTTCCGHHPDVHDELCGCMISGCFCLCGVDQTLAPQAMNIHEAMAMLNTSVASCQELLIGVGIKRKSGTMTTTQFYQLKQYLGG